jgi:hypothetical protein
MIQCVLQDMGGAVYNVKAYGAVGNGTTDDTAAFKNAIFAAGAVFAGTVLVPPGQYKIASTLILTTVGMRLVGTGRGGFFGQPQLIWGGATDGGLLSPVTIISVPNGAHGAGVEGLTLDGGLKAGVCIHVEDGPVSTFSPVIRNVNFTGYRRRGLVLGLDLDETLPEESRPAGVMQMEVVNCPGLSFAGGSLNAVGVVLNAQNAEWVRFTGVYFDPPSNESAHRHHIFANRGGVAVEDCISSRAVDYAIVAAERFRIAGWNSEDRYLLKTASGDPGGPCTLSNIQQRDHPGPSGPPTATDATIKILATQHSVSMDGLTIQGVVTLAPTEPVTVTALGVRSVKASDPFELQGSPRNQSGLLHALLSGDLRLRGSAPRLRLQTADDRTLVDMRGGAGAPNGVVTAAVGAIWIRTDGGAGSTLYVKESGTGNTGWVAK